MHYQIRFSSLTLVCLLFCLGVANSTVTTDSTNSTQITLQYALQNQDYQISAVKINRGDYTFITLKDASRDRKKGEPDLPQIAQAVIIPDKGRMQLEIIESQFTEIKVNAIVPSKGSLSRKINPADVPYVFGPVYLQNTWFPKLCAHLGKPYIAGDYRGGVVYFQPFQYNPVSNTLRIYSKISVRITYTSEPGINEKSRSGGLLINPSFDQIYSHSFVNYPKTHHQIITEEGSMLVISHKDFIPAVEPFVDWKNKRGVKTELVDVATIGNSADSIQKYVANYYKDKTKNLKYLLLVGDADKIPPLKNTDWIDSDAKNGTSDNMYGMIEGDDAYMEIFVGRLSGDSAVDIKNQVDKILYYERKTSVNDTWLGNAVGTADTTERDDMAAINYILRDLSGYNYKSINKYTIATVDNPKMVSDVNKGIGVHFNASHGDVDLTVALVNDDVTKMTNVNKYPFNFTLACLPGKFDTTSECLAEALLHKENGGFAGAFMATINQTWDEPCVAIKEQADILCEKYPSNIKRTYGGIAINGCFKMLDQYPTEGPEQLRCWELFGDPNMHVYTSTPIAMTITHPANVDTGIQNIIISGTDKATVCLYSKKLGIQKVLDLSSGKAGFSIPVSGKDGDTIYVTGTMYNHVTYEGHMIVQTGTTTVSLNKTAQIKTFSVSFTDSYLNYQIPDGIGENKDMAVIVRLFTPQGKLVSIVTDGNKGPGRYSVTFTKNGRKLARGSYLGSVEIGNFKKVMKFVIK